MILKKLQGKLDTPGMGTSSIRMGQVAAVWHKCTGEVGQMSGYPSSKTVNGGKVRLVSIQHPTRSSVTRHEGVEHQMAMASPSNAAISAHWTHMWGEWTRGPLQCEVSQVSLNTWCKHWRIRRIHCMRMIH